MVYFTKMLQEIICPVPGCTEVSHSSGILHKHFMFRHLISKMAAVQEGKEPLPHCDMCGMHMLAGRLIRHRKTARCDRNTHMRWRRRYVEIAAKCLEGIIGGRRLLPGRPPPPPPPDFQVIPAAQSGSDTPGAGAPGQTESGAGSQTLARSHCRQAVSEGSLPP